MFGKFGYKKNRAGIYLNNNTNTLLNNLYAAFNYENNANDLSGNGYNATIVGTPTYTTGQFRKAISLNGSQYLYSGSNSDFDFGSNDFTISIWFKLNDLVGSYYGFNKGNGFGGANDAFGSYFSAGTFNVFINTNSTSVFLSSNFTADTNWHNYIIERDNNTLNLYIDNVLDKTGAVTGAMNTVPFRYYHTLNVLNLNGLIDSHNVWTRILTSNEKLILQTKQYPFT